MSDEEFIQTFFKIIDKHRKEVPFMLNDVQAALAQAWAAWNVILKYRKPGVSVYVQAKFLSRCLRKKNRNAVVLSFDKAASIDMLERTHWIIDHLPFKVKLDRESRNEFYIRETNSKMYIGTPGTRAFGRGSDITDLHISEYAHWEDTSVMTGLMEALTYDAFVAVESTANGPTNEYAKLYRKGKLENSQWKSHFFAWWVDKMLVSTVEAGFVHTEEEKILKVTYNLSDMQLMWRRKKLADMLEPELFPQEFPANEKEAFITLGDCVFNAKALNRYDQLVRPANYTGELVTT